MYQQGSNKATYLKFKDMILGTDISLKVCKAEGYTMIEFDGRKKFNSSSYYRIFDYYPEYLEEIGGEIANNVSYSFNELKEFYLEDREGMDKCCETNTNINFENPSYYDFLNLASDLIMYKGL